MSNPIVINPSEVVALSGAGTCPYSHALHWNADRTKRWCQGCLDYYPPGEEHMTLGSDGNQARLNNGCVCDSGCEACDALAESWEAMRQVALAVVSYDNFVNTFPQNRFSVASAQAIIERYENMRDKARAALALAARVKA